MRALGLALLTTCTAGLLITPPTATAAPADSAGVAQVRAYVEALISHNPDGVRFAPDATRVENGARTATTGAQIADDLRNSPVYKTFQDYRELSITRHGDLIVGHWLLDAGIAGVRMATTTVDESFVIPDGMIHHLDARIATTAF